MPSAAMLLYPALQKASTSSKPVPTAHRSSQVVLVSQQQKISYSGLAAQASSWKQVKYSIMEKKEGREASRYIFAGAAQTDFYRMPSSSVPSKRRGERLVAIFLPVRLKPTSTRCPARAQCPLSAVSVN
jgi:hypothetical protein